MKIMKKFKRLLLSRNFVITIILLILGAVLIAYIFPQRMTSSQFEIDQWKQSYPFWAPLYESLGLDHVYTSPWFSVLLFVFLLMLIISTIDQMKISCKKTFGQEAASGSKSMKISVSDEDLISTLKKTGYRQTYKDDSVFRFVKQPWGYWGNVLLHLGIVFVIGSSLLITVTETRGLLHLLEGETYLPGNPWVVEETGMFAERFILPVAVKLDKVITEFWETDDVKTVSTVVSFTDIGGNVKQYDLGINRAANFAGLRIYQGRRFGNAFYVVFTDAQGRQYKAILQIEHPPGREKPAYENFFIDGIPYMLKAKYFADAERRSIESKNPLLVLRFVIKEQSIDKISRKDKGVGGLTMKLAEKENIIGEVSLKIGESKPLGAYTVRLVHVSKWSGVIFVKNIGMSGIFSGFFIIIIGVSFTYFMPPREFLVRKDAQGFSLSWSASKFERFYEDEFEKISDAFREKNAL